MPIKRKFLGELLVEVGMITTDQLDEWYEYLVDAGIEMKYELKSKEGSAHDGFVIEDPEGYLLEFERFNDHPENKNFTPKASHPK